MNMMGLTISSEDMQGLEQEQFHHPHPGVQRKMEAVYLKGMELPRCSPLDEDAMPFLFRRVPRR